MQELIKELKDLQESLDPYGLHDAIEFAESMLEKEKEVMIDFAYKYGDETLPEIAEWYDKEYTK